MTAPTQNAANVLPLAAKPSVSYVTVTPETAQRWLDGNTVNRRIREAKVNQFARDMTAGHWHLSNDAICFSPDGKLLNGQHRLTAVVRSGVDVVMLVARNMPPVAMTVMDTGSARSASDALKFDGESHTALLASTTKLTLLYDSGRLYRDTKVQATSHSEIRAFLAAHPELRHSVDVAERARKGIDAPPTALAAAHWIIASKAGVSLADFYLSQLSTRTNEPDGSAVLAVDSRLRELRRNRTVLPARNVLYLLIKGWNYYAAGATVRRLAVQPKGEFRIPEPSTWRRA